MIRNQWYAILESSEVEPGRPVGVLRMGERLVLWRDAQGGVACLRDLCPHRGAALSIGKVIGHEVQCPFHGFRFDPSGQCTLIPANGRAAPVPKAMKVQAYPARDAHGFIWIWWGEPREDLPPIRFFESLDSSFSYATLRDLWHTHYSRAIENQLDVVHLPFVHHNTIGRGNRTVVNGPYSEWDCKLTDCNRLDIWVKNEVDTGQIALGPRDLARPDRRPFLQFQFPNVWHNWIADSTRVVAAFAPIDDEHTMMYVRFYQNMVRVPVLRDLFNLVARPANGVILRQDKGVVASQQPKRSELKMGELLIPGDLPIIEYRKRRQELIEQAAQQAPTG